MSEENDGGTLKVLIATMLVSLLVALWTGNAHAAYKPALSKGGMKVEDFFDIERARDYWTDLETRQDFLKVGKYCDTQTRYGEVAEPLWYKGPTAISRIKGLSAKELEDIKACYDLEQAWYLFKKGYRKWRKAWVAWGDDVDAETCTHMEKYNILMDDCDDLPDWRSEDSRKDDLKRAEQAPKIHAQRAKEKRAWEAFKREMED